MSSESLEVQVVEDKGSTNKLTASVNALADASDKLAKSAKGSTDATKQQGDAADTAAKKNGTLKSALGGAADAFGGLKTALGGVAALLTIDKVIGYADAYSGISNKLRLVTTDQAKLNGIIEASYKIAQDTSTSFKQVSDVYGKVSAAVKGYNGNAKDVPIITKAIAQAVALTGPTSEEAANGLRQFGQTMDIGKLQAEEFNAILEGTPGLAKSLEAGIRSSGLQIEGSLKQMAADGKISSQMLLEGLKRIAPELDILAKGAIPTVAQAMTRLENAFIKYIGQGNAAISGTALISKAIGLLADNLNIVVPALVLFAGVLALGTLAGAINSIRTLTTGIGALTIVTRASTVAFLTNPLFLAATVATLGFLAVGLARTGGSFGELGNRIAAAGTAVLNFLAPVGNFLVKIVSFYTGLAKSGLEAIGMGNAVKTATAALTALVPAITGATTAQAANSGSATVFIDQQTKVGVALKKVRDEAALVPAAVAGVAPALGSVGTAGSTMATSLRTGADGVLTVRNGFGAVAQAAPGAVAGFQSVSGAATGSLPGFAGVSKAATDTSAGFLEVSMNANRVAPAVTAASTASTTAATGLTTVGTSANAAATGIGKIGEVTITTGLKLSELTASTDPCAVALGKVGTASEAIVPPMERAAAAAEKAREMFDKQGESADKAGKASEEYAKRLEKLSGAYNQLGEKLETAEQAQARYKKAEDASNKAIQDSLDNLKQYYREADTATSSTKALGSAAQSTSGDFTALGQTFSSAQAAMDALNRSVGNYAAMSKSARDAMYEEVTAYNAARNARNSYASSGGSGSGSNQRGPNGDSSYYSDSNVAQREAEKGSTSMDDDSFSVSSGGNSVSGSVFSFGGYKLGMNPTNSPYPVNPWGQTSLQNWKLFLNKNADVFPTSGRYFNPKLVGELFFESSSYGAREAGRIDPREYDRRAGVPQAAQRESEDPWSGASAFAGGGSFMVGGNGGTDSQPVRFWATPNERVTVETPSQRMQSDRGAGGDGGGTASNNRRIVNNTFNIKTTDADSFKRTRKQTYQDLTDKIRRSL